MRLAHVSLALAVLLPAFSETHALDKEKGAAMLDTAAKEGVELRAKTTTRNSAEVGTVRKSVGVTAVLLTQPSVRRLFGKEIAATYAVVQLTISNKNAEAAFVLHSAYIDTSQWALGGGTRGFSTDDDRKGERPVKGDPLSARAGSRPNRISSVESRIARGQLLDAQQWSARNWTIRLLTVAGSLASGYTFAFKETGIAKGIAAFNGNLVPGVAFAWPDGAVAQQNRISDFGYQTNKIIGKQSSDIIVCFFPIDMFLSAPFRQIFLKSPGLFLSPYQLLFKNANQQVREAMGIKDNELEQLQQLQACYSKGFEPPFEPQKGKRQSQEEASAPPSLQEMAQRRIEDTCGDMLNHADPRLLITLDYIGRFGIQNIGVFVDGIMTVDVDTVPASIDQVVFDGDASKPDFWAVPGEKKGTIQCRFCENGQVSILEADKVGITDVAAATDGSNDHTVKFSFKTTKPIEPGQNLTFVITKKPTDPKSTQEVKSAPFIYTVGFVQVTPSISKVAVEDKKVTVTGSGFFNTKINPLSALLHSDGKDKDVPVTLPDGQAQDKLTFDIPSGLAPGCWNVHVKLGSMEASAPNKKDQKILSEAAPKLTEAARNASSITVKGEQLVDTTGCGGKALKFQLQQAAPPKGAQPKPVDVTAKLNSSSEATLNLPDAAKKGDWTVHVLEGTDDVSNTKLK